MGRRESRESAFIILYQADIQKCGPEEVKEIYYSEHTLTDSEKSYIDKAVVGVFENLEEIDKKISKGLNSWTLSRISKIDKAALRLAVYEIFYDEDIPEHVSIYEAVELVKKFDCEKSGGFVNGILRSIVRTSQENGENVE